MNFNNKLLALFLAQICIVVPPVYAFDIGIHAHAQRYSQNALQITSNLENMDLIVFVVILHGSGSKKNQGVFH